MSDDLEVTFRRPASREPFIVPREVFLGYRAKKVWFPWQEGVTWIPGVEEVCSASEDMCEMPEEWHRRWDFNRALCWNTEREAISTIPEDGTEYWLFATRLIPARSCLGEEPRAVSDADVLPKDDFPDPPEAVTSDPPYESLGYDVLEISTWYGNSPVHGFGYSRLMSSGFAPGIPVNRYGLMNTLDEAIPACEFIEQQMRPDHGPHYVVRVARRRITPEET